MCQDEQQPAESAGCCSSPMLREDISYNFAPAFDRSQERRARDSWIRRWFRLEASTKAAWSGVPASIAIVASITVTGFWIEPEVNGSNLAILYMLAVIFSALRWSRRAAILSAVFGALSLDFFFVPPFRSFAVSDIWYLITLVGLLTVGLVVSILTVEAREEAAFARRREACTAAL